MLNQDWGSWVLNIVATIVESYCHRIGAPQFYSSFSLFTSFINSPFQPATNFSITTPLHSSWETT